MGRVIRDIRAIIDKTPLPPGNFVSLEGQFQAQEQATRLIAGLSVVSLAMMFLVLYSRYQLGGAGRHHHGQHPAGTDRLGGGDVDRRREPCRWRRWWASSRWPASPRATAS